MDEERNRAAAVERDLRRCQLLAFLAFVAALVATGVAFSQCAVRRDFAKKSGQQCDSIAWQAWVESMPELTGNTPRPLWSPERERSVALLVGLLGACSGKPEGMKAVWNGTGDRPDLTAVLQRALVLAGYSGAHGTRRTP